MNYHIIYFLKYLEQSSSKLSVVSCQY